MKIYDKNYEDFIDFNRKKRTIPDMYGDSPVNFSFIDEISSAIGSVDVLSQKLRTVLKKSHRDYFDTVVKYVWLEGQFSFRGERNPRKVGGGDLATAWSFFLGSVVGVNRDFLTVDPRFSAVASYLLELFPEFLSHDPYEEPEYFSYPFSHVLIDQMLLVQYVDERMEMLRYSDKKKWSFVTFANWAVNQVSGYNDEVGEIIYEVTPYEEKDTWMKIRNKRKGREWKQEVLKKLYQT